MSHLKTRTLAAMRRIARASTVELFEEKVQLLIDDEELWGQTLFRKWFEKTWLRQHKASPFSVVQYIPQPPPTPPPPAHDFVRRNTDTLAFKPFPIKWTT